MIIMIIVIIISESLKTYREIHTVKRVIARKGVKKTSLV